MLIDASEAFLIELITKPRKKNESQLVEKNVHPDNQNRNTANISIANEVKQSQRSQVFCSLLCIVNKTVVAEKLKMVSVNCAICGHVYGFGNMFRKKPINSFENFVKMHSINQGIHWHWTKLLAKQHAILVY